MGGNSPLVQPSDIEVVSLKAIAYSDELAYLGLFTPNLCCPPSHNLGGLLLMVQECNVSKSHLANCQ